MLDKLNVAIKAILADLKGVKADVNRLKVRPVPKDGISPDPKLVAQDVLAQIEKPKDGISPKLADIVAAVLSEIPTPKDGVSPDIDAISFKVLAQIEKPKDGISPKLSDIVNTVLARIPTPKDGISPDVELIAQEVLSQLPEVKAAEPGKQGLRGTKGKDGVSVTKVKLEKGNKLAVWLDGVRRVVGVVEIPKPEATFTPGGGGGNKVTAANTPNNLIPINSIGDLPDPIGGEYVLLPGKVYEQGEALNIGTTCIRLREGTKWTQNNINGPLLEFDGTGSIFVAEDVTFEVSDCLVSAPNGQVFDAKSAGGRSDRAIINDCIVVACNKYGTFDNMRVLSITNANYVDADKSDMLSGITLKTTTGASNWSVVAINQFGMFSNDPDFVGIDLTDTVHRQFELNDLIIRGDGGPDGRGIKALPNNGNMAPGVVAKVKDSEFTGVQPLEGVTSADIRWLFSQNDGTPSAGVVPVSSIAANPTLDTATTVPVGVGNQGVYIKVNQGNWSSALSERLGTTDDGDIINDTEQCILLQVNGFVTLEKVGGGADLVNARLVYNDDPSDPQSTDTTNGTKNTDATSVPLIGLFTMLPGDTVSVYTANIEGTSDILVSNSKLSTLRAL